MNGWTLFTKMFMSIVLLLFSLFSPAAKKETLFDDQTMLNEKSPERKYCNRCTLVCTLQTRLLGWPGLVRATSGPGHYRLSPKAHYGELSRQHQQQKYEEVSLDDTVERLGGNIHTETVTFTYARA